MTQPFPPPDPMTPLAAQAAGMHEIYLAHVAAQFTERQAMEIVIAITTAFAVEAFKRQN